MPVTLTEASRMLSYNVYGIDGKAFVGYPTDAGLYCRFPGATLFEFVPYSAIVNGKITYTPTAPGGQTLTGEKLKSHHGSA